MDYRLSTMDYTKSKKMINNNFITGLILANRAKKNLENKGADVSKNFQLKNALIFGMTGSNTIVPQLVLQKEIEKNEPDITTAGLQKIATLEAAHAEKMDVCKQEIAGLADSYVKTCQAIDSLKISDKQKAEIKATIPKSIVDAAVPVSSETVTENESYEDEQAVVMDRKGSLSLESLVHIGTVKAKRLHEAGIYTFKDIMNEANEKTIKKYVSPAEFVTIKAKAQEGIEIEKQIKGLNQIAKKQNTVVQ